jgi:methylated-DNA-[protein]-cysteine S-methyltransferase
MRYRTIESPLGELLLAGDGGGLWFLGFPSGKGRLVPGADWVLQPDCFSAVEVQLAQYFEGRRTSFDLQLTLSGTEFQLDVLNALGRIPYGETRTYREIATAIGRPKAVRAVGAANGRNPLPIIIPCHRVIGADGSLTGFGGGLAAKTFLLELESRAGR